MRLDGFYWVKHNSFGLVVAEWVLGAGWQLPGYTYSVPESDMVFISQRRLTFRRS